jgi:phage-related protein
MTCHQRKRVAATFYRSGLGREPVRDWLLSLAKLDRQAIGTNIKTVEFGWPVGMPVCRSMKGGLYEVRTNLENGRISRVLFFFHGGMMVLLHGFIKKSQTTPKSDFELARQRKQEVENG